VGNPYAPPDPNRPPPERPETGRPEPERPQQRPPDPEKAREVGRSVGRFALLMLAGLLCVQLPVPWQAAGIVFTVAGLVVGVQTVRRAVAARLRPPVVVWLALGLAMGALMLLLQLGMLAVWPAAFEMQECRERALTLRAEEECRRDYERWIQERAGLPTD
jgi:hypothetical protein